MGQLQDTGPKTPPKEKQSFPELPVSPLTYKLFKCIQSVSGGLTYYKFFNSYIMFSIPDFHVITRYTVDLERLLSYNILRFFRRSIISSHESSLNQSLRILTAIRFITI